MRKKVAHRNHRNFLLGKTDISSYEIKKPTASLLADKYNSIRTFGRPLIIFRSIWRMCIRNFMKTQSNRFEIVFYLLKVLQT